VLGYEERGWNPANRQSYLMSEELLGCQSLEDLVQDERFDFSLKQKLIKEVALLTRTMHLAGINHRDYYLCHFPSFNISFN
jgi:heptose I phosphotransferase